MNLNCKIDILMLENQIKDKLKENKIIYLKELCDLKKRELLQKGFSLYEIEQIEIKLQLEGLDLKR